MRPFQTPIKRDKSKLLAADLELICDTEAATDQELEWIMMCVNEHDGLMDIARSLSDWEAAPDRYGGDLAELALQAGAIVSRLEGRHFRLGSVHTLWNLENRTEQDYRVVKISGPGSGDRSVSVTLEPIGDPRTWPDDERPSPREES